MRRHIEGGALHQHRHRKEQPHEVVLPRQRRGQCDQAEQDAELLGIRERRSPRLPRHDRDEAEPKQCRQRQRGPVRRPVIDIDDIHRARRLGEIVLIVVDRPDQAMRDGDQRLVDPRPVLLVTLAKALFRARSDHALIPDRKFGRVVLEAADRCRHDIEKDAGEGDHADKGGPLAPPEQIGQHRNRKHLDGGGEREHEAGEP